MITPPHVGWEANMRKSFESGALEAITEVLTKHKGDEEVLSSSTACLSSLATNPAYAGRLVESGAMLSMVASVTANPAGTQVSTVTLGVRRAPARGRLEWRVRCARLGSRMRYIAGRRHGARAAR